MVAAWSSAETGVGPSIASGSQTWSGNCALLPMTARNKHRPIHMCRVGSLGAVQPNPPVATKSRTTPTTKPMSASLVVQKAFTAARAALGFCQ